MDVFEKKAAISGIGPSAIWRRLGRSGLDLTLEAIMAALDDAGVMAELRCFGQENAAGSYKYEAADHLGPDAVVQRCDLLGETGALYRPTARMREMAARRPERILRQGTR